MNEHDADPARVPNLALSTDQYRLREQTDDDAAAQPNFIAQPARTSGEPRSWPPAPWQRRLIQIGVIVAVLAATAVALLQLRLTPRALAAPDQAAHAAKRAGTFAFATRSELRLADSPGRVTRTDGEVDLTDGGAFSVHVANRAGLGFERVVFPTAVYVRGIGPHGPRAWLGARVSPPAAIGIHTSGAGGVSDPLGLLAVLAHSGHSRRLAHETVDGQPTTHYRLRATLGAFLPTGSRVPPRVEAIPVRIDVWQADSQRLVRAVRTFDIGGVRRERLVVTTNFTNYAKQTAIHAPPGVPLRGSQPLAPSADDPLGASVLNTLALGDTHGATAARSRSSVPGNAERAPARRGPTRAP